MQLHDQLHKMPLTIYMDEAGRGPLAGPVGVGAVIKCQTQDFSHFGDSKIFSPNRRTQLMQDIDVLQHQGIIAYGYGQSSAPEIDRHGIITAIQIASIRAIAQALIAYYQKILHHKLLTSVWGEDHIYQIAIDAILTNTLHADGDMLYFIRQFVSIAQKQFQRKGLIRDGNHRFALDTILQCPVQTIVRGDAKVPLIGMASIVAKYHRDEHMCSLDSQYPKWGFAQHKGYGTLGHRNLIQSSKENYQKLTPMHRMTYLKHLYPQTDHHGHHPKSYRRSSNKVTTYNKPGLLLHICCAPDLSRPLHLLRDYFKLYLFRYNPNIHPQKEHDLRYEQFVKLYQLAPGDYEIVQDWYDPKEFFDSFVTYRTLIKPELKDADRSQILKEAGAMEERSDRCNPCYLMRLEQGARQAQKLGIRYFSSTLLISPKKVASKLFQYGLQAQQQTTDTQFLWFDFAKNDGYHKASQLTKHYDLYRQNYCGCGWTIPKAGEKRSGYHGG